MHNQTCCFTGHRQIPSRELIALAVQLFATVAELADKGVIHFKTGGALGFDTLAARIVLKARYLNPIIRLELVLPCKEQTKGWDEYDIEEYNDILQEADSVVYMAEQYYPGCMYKRNVELVNNSGYCVAYHKHDRTGTAQTVRLARERGLTVYNLAENLDIERYNLSNK